MITIRASKTDLAEKCNQSLIEPETRIEVAGEQADAGTVAHIPLAILANGLEPDLEAIAVEKRCDAEALRIIVALGRQAIEGLRAHGFLGIGMETERALPPVEIGDGIMLTGTVDVSMVAEAMCSIVDWKTGRDPTRHSAQTQSYSLLQSKAHGDCHVRAGEVWLWKRKIHIDTYSPEQLAAFGRHLAQLVERATRETIYRPGVHCGLCPRAIGCAARRDHVRDSIVTMTTAGQIGIEDRVAIGALYDRAKQVRYALAAYDKALEAALEAGPIALPDGSVLAYETSERERYTATAAHAYLTSIGATPEEIDGVLTCGKTNFAALVKSRVAKGQGAAAMREAHAAIQAAGGVETYDYREKVLTPAPVRAIAEESSK